MKKGEKFTYNDAHNLYYELRSILKPVYLDSIDEEYACINTLLNALNEGIQRDYIIMKAKLFSLKQSDFKQKLCNLIEAKFWI